MTTILRKYQKKGVRLIEGFDGRALLADEMGLGKTVQALWWFDNFLPPDAKAIVICPASVKYNWQREAAHHCNIRADVLSGAHPPRCLPNSRLLIINYDILYARKGQLVSWLDLLTEWNADLVINDEAHYIKSPEAKRSKAVAMLCETVPHVLMLSGTPLTNRPSELYNIVKIVVPDAFPSRTAFYWRYCLPANAPILMADLTEKPISEVKIGDSVVGWAKPDGRRRRLVVSKVLDTLQKKSTLQKITLSDGNKIICTPDHEWGVGYAGGYSDFFPVVEGKSEGRKIMKVFRGTESVYEETEEYMLGYIHGAFRGDGHCTKHKRGVYHPFKETTRKYAPKYKCGLACKDTEITDRLSRYLTYFDIDHYLQLRVDGLTAMRQLNRKEVYDFLSKGTTELDCDEWWAGFLGGIYDTEGSGACISQCTIINSVTEQMIQTALTRFGFKIKPSENRVRFEGTRSEMMRFWSISNPAVRRKLIAYMLSAGGCYNSGGVSILNNPTIIKVQQLTGIHTTYTLTTETGNYVAYGMGSRNCNPKVTRWGLDVSGASNLDELHEKLTSLCMIRRKKCDVLKELPAKVRTVVPMQLTDKDRKEYERCEREFVHWLWKISPQKARSAEKAEYLVKRGYLRRLAGMLKQNLVIQWIEDFLEESDEKLIFFGIHKNFLRPIFNKLKKVSVMVDGSTTGIRRQQAFDKFTHNKETRLLIGNIQAAGIGWNGQVASNVAFGELDEVPGNMTQAEDRTHRIGQMKGVICHYLISAGTIEDKICKVLEGKQKVITRVLDGIDVKEFDITTRVDEELLAKYGLIRKKRKKR